MRTQLLVMSCLLFFFILPSEAVKLETRAEWGFLKNIINIDTFFAAPDGGGKKRHGDSLVQAGAGGLESAAQLDDEPATNKTLEETPEQKARRETHIKQQKELAEKYKLKKQIEKEAAEKAVEAMMVSLDEEDTLNSTSTSDNSASSEQQQTQSQNATAKSGSHKLEQNQPYDKFNFTLIYSMPSSPDDVKVERKVNMSSLKQVQSFYDKGLGLKMLLVEPSRVNKSQGGKLLKTNVRLEDNEFEYYRLLGEAYNQHILQRASISKSDLTGILNATKTTAPTSLFAYVIDGIPQTQEHDHLYDVKYGYAKMVFVKDQQPKKNKQEQQFKVYTSTCKKLRFNVSKTRQNECRLATGYFLVAQAGLFLDQCGLDQASLQKCASIKIGP